MRSTSLFANALIGGEIDLMAPDVESIHIEDIATSLSHICRYGGQIPRFYSVAQHCVLCSEHLDIVQGSPPLLLQKHALMHDAAEAYMGDIVTPLKRFMRFVLPHCVDGRSSWLHCDFSSVEDGVLKAVFARFGMGPLSAMESGSIAGIDMLMALVEAKNFFPDERWKTFVRPGLGAITLPDIVIEPWGPDLAREKFLNRFGQLFG